MSSSRRNRLEQGISQPKPQSKLRSVFLRHEELRPLWGLLLFGAIYMALQTAVASPLEHMLSAWNGRSHVLTPGHLLGHEVIQCALLLISTVLLAKIEGRRIAVYNFGDSTGWIRFCWGCLSGFAALSVLVGTLWRLHLLVFDRVGLHGTDVLKFALAWAVTLFIACFYEVVLLRGYLQFTLGRGIGFWFAALTLSIVYSLWLGEGRAGFLYITNAFSLNVFLFLSLWYTRSFWWGVGFLAAWDWAQIYFFGAADSGFAAEGHLLSTHTTGCILWSGGAIGPEGSLLVSPLMLLLSISMWLHWRRGDRARGVPTLTSGKQEAATDAS
jgi:membrane protease YdiL (CAAX protease family)